MKVKTRYLYFYIVFTVFYNLIYIKDVLPIFLQILISTLIPFSQVLLLIFGVFLLYQDYRVNEERSVLSLPYVKWVLLYALYLLILTIFQKRLFSTYNNSFFIIHSILFFLITLIYGNKYKWIKSIVKISILFTVIVSIFSIGTSIFYLVNKKVFLDKIEVWSAAHIFTYLLVFSFYLYIFLIVYYKRSKIKYLFITLLIINYLNLFIMESHGAIFALFLSLLIFSVVALILMKKEEYEYFFEFMIAFVLIIAVSIIIVLYSIYSKTNLALGLNNFFGLNHVSFSWLKDGSLRVKIWEIALNLDKKVYLFGISDKSAYMLYIDKLPYLSHKFFVNSANYYNLYISLLVNYGIFALVGFLFFLVASFVLIIRGYINSSFRRKRFILLFLFQFIAILICGFFEELPLFTHSIHSLLFLLSWSAALCMSDGER